MLKSFYRINHCWQGHIFFVPKLNGPVCPDVLPFDLKSTTTFAWFMRSYQLNQNVGYKDAKMSEGLSIFSDGDFSCFFITLKKFWSTLLKILSQIFPLLVCCSRHILIQIFFVSSYADSMKTQTCSISLGYLKLCHPSCLDCIPSHWSLKQWLPYQVRQIGVLVLGVDAFHRKESGYP